MKAARDKAAEGRTLIKAGVDPISQWNRPEAAEMPTFGTAADAFLAGRSNEWRNEKHKAQWTMPYADVPAFIQGLRGRPATVARALEFCILTAACSGEALAARWDEIDLDAKILTVSPARTKAARASDSAFR